MTARVEDHGDHSVTEFSITKPGKLGIEFRSTSSPYFVINVSAEAQSLYGVHPGDLLLSVKRETDTDWTDCDGLEWSALVDVLKCRPALAKFKRFKIQSQDKSQTQTIKATSPTSENSPSRPNPELEAKAALFYHPSPTLRADSSPQQPIKSPFVQASSAASPRGNISPSSGLPPQARRPSMTESPTEISLVYSAEGPLGLEFEEMDFPYRVGGVRAGSMSAEKGVRKGDSLKTVNGKKTIGMSWDDIRSELSKRPAEVVFIRDPTSTGQQAPNSIWDVAAGLIRAGGSTTDPVDELRRERDELRQIVSSVGAEDLVVLRQVARDYNDLKGSVSHMEEMLDSLKKERDSASNLVEEERLKNLKLVEVIDEIEKSQSTIIERFEREVQEKERLINELRIQRDRSGSLNVHTSDAQIMKLEHLEETIKEKDAKLELIEKDNTRLRKENMELGGMVQQCLEKIQRDLSDKPHWVDRRVVCSAIGTLLRDLDKIDYSMNNAVDLYMSAMQKLGDVLGMTYEERTSVGLLAVPTRLVRADSAASPERGPSIGEDFVTFLEREATGEQRS